MLEDQEKKKKKPVSGHTTEKRLEENEKCDEDLLSYLPCSE